MTTTKGHDFWSINIRPKFITDFASFDNSIILWGSCGTPGLALANAGALNVWGYLWIGDDDKIKEDLDATILTMAGKVALSGERKNWRAGLIAAPHAMRFVPMMGSGGWQAIANSQRLYLAPKISELRVWCDWGRDGFFSSTDKIYEWSYSVGSDYPFGDAPPLSWPICGALPYKIKVVFDRKMDLTWGNTKFSLDPRGKGTGHGPIDFNGSWSVQGDDNTWQGTVDIAGGDPTQMDSIPSEYCDIAILARDSFNDDDINGLDTDGDGEAEPDPPGPTDRNHKLNLEIRNSDRTER